MNNVSRIG